MRIPQSLWNSEELNDGTKLVIKSGPLGLTMAFEEAQNDWQWRFKSVSMWLTVAFKVVDRREFFNGNAAMCGTYMFKWVKREITWAVGPSIMSEQIHILPYWIQNLMIIKRGGL